MYTRGILRLHELDLNVHIIVINHSTEFAVDNDCDEKCQPTPTIKMKF